MPSTSGRLDIRCVKVDAEYILQFRGVEWSETVSSIEEAIQRAGELIVEETVVVFYDATGIGVVMTMLFPFQEKTATRGGAEWAERLLRVNPPGNRFAQLKTVLATRGVRGAVQYLNSLTAHRFTSLYKFDGPTLHRITFYDRENPEADHSEDVPIESSYCVFVRDLHGPFIMDDSGADERVQDHPKREILQRYCGVPLLDEMGRMYGSICHFDFAPGRIEETEVALLERLAALLRPSFAIEGPGAPQNHTLGVGAADGAQFPGFRGV